MINQGIVLREVVDAKGLKVFVKLPAMIHKDHSNWIPPIYMDAYSFFDPKKIQLFGIVIISVCWPIVLAGLLVESWV